MNNRIKRDYITRYIPVLVEVEVPVIEEKVVVVEKEVMTPKGMPNMKWKDEIEEYNAWYIETEGNVTLNHGYTRDGLYKLVGAIEAIAKANDTDMSIHAADMKRVKQLADEMQEDKYSDVHADKAGLAFGLVSKLLTKVQKENNFDYNVIDRVSDASRKIDPDVLYTKQAEHVYNFFDAATKAVNKMAEATTWVAK